ncbi:MAG: phosphoribosylanthranilate isomerase [Hyphomonadaceae bacterium]
MADAKICGVVDAATVDAAITGGARFIGMVRYPKSPRHVGLDAAAALAARARGRVDVVVLTVDAPDSELDDIARVVRPDWIQAHGRESPPRTAALRRFACKGVIKAIGLAHATDLTQAEAYAPAADMLLFDAKPPAGGLPGGNALAFDWKILAGQRISRPWMLAGGLSPANVAEAIRLSGAGLVDVSSGVEAAPGLKDPALIAQFLAAARSI